MAVFALGGILMILVYVLVALMSLEDSAVQMYKHKVVTQTGSLELELPW